MTIMARLGVRPVLRSLTACLFVFLQTPAATAQNIRPIRDSIGFCWNAGEMDAFMKFLEAHADPAPPPPGALVAAVSVHDDYLYAGKVYYPLYSTVRAKEVVIFGVTHGTVARELGPQSNVVILDGYDRWRGPYGEVGISPLRSVIRDRLPSEFVLVNDRAHAIEHSIEALIPFLQYYTREVTITPIMVTRMPLQRMKDLSGMLAGIFADYIAANHLQVGKDIVFLMSNDADHYGPDFNNAPYGTDARAHERATSNDRRIISTCLTGDISASSIETLAKEIWPDSTSMTPVPVWCGRYPVTLGLLTVTDLMSRLGKSPVRGSLLKYSDTFSEGVLPVKNTSMGLTAVFSYRHWCAWFTEGFYVKD
jgi:AmmeMemoRadiSam system protein B